MMWGYSDGWGWGMLFGGMWMLLFWAGVIFLVVWAINRLTHHPPAGPSETPLDIAKRRLAGGEITPEQFEEIRRRLT